MLRCHAIQVAEGQVHTEQELGGLEIRENNVVAMPDPLPTPCRSRVKPMGLRLSRPIKSSWMGGPHSRSVVEYLFPQVGLGSFVTTYGKVNGSQVFRAQHDE